MYIIIAEHKDLFYHCYYAKSIVPLWYSVVGEPHWIENAAVFEERSGIFRMDIIPMPQSMIGKYNLHIYEYEHLSRLKQNFF